METINFNTLRIKFEDDLEGKLVNESKSIWLIDGSICNMLIIDE